MGKMSECRKMSINWGGDFFQIQIFLYICDQDGGGEKSPATQAAKQQEAAKAQEGEEEEAHHRGEC
jgi:hypothetical protein